MINISTYLGELSKTPYVSKFPIHIKKTYTEGLEVRFYSEFGGNDEEPVASEAVVPVEEQDAAQ